MDNSANGQGVFVDTFRLVQGLAAVGAGVIGALRARRILPSCRHGHGYPPASPRASPSPPTIAANRFHEEYALDERCYTFGGADLDS